MSSDKITNKITNEQKLSVTRTLKSNVHQTPSRDTSSSNITKSVALCFEFQKTSRFFWPILSKTADAHIFLHVFWV